MRYTLEVAPSVTRDASRIYAYREGERKGAGERFIKALIECYTQIRSNPYGFQVRKEPFRHAHLHRLKYRVVFKVEGTLVLVVQVRHTSRKVSKKHGP